MKNHLIGLLTVVLMFSVPPSFADGPGWTANSTVLKVVMVSNGGVNIRLVPGLAGCTSQSGYGPAYASIYPDHPGIDKMFAGLTAAYMANKTVALYLVDGTCKVGEVELGGR